MPEAVYIHIPFCKYICFYCDFCKFYYNKRFISEYFEPLKKEIQSIYKNNLIKTIYIGGGTPNVLTMDELKELFEIIKIFKTDDCLEFTIEANVELLTEEQLLLFKENGVTRLSIGVQTFNDKHLEALNRNHNKEIALKGIRLAKKYFDNVNIDMMYSLPNQTMKELKDDISEFLKFGIPHVSFYGLIIEERTEFYIKGYENVSEELELDMYNHILQELKANEYIHYETSNYAKEGYESLHNLTYWNNEEYYGFGCGAASYIDGVRINNTRSHHQYISGAAILKNNPLSINEKIENEFILGLRKIRGINKENFFNKYNIKLDNIDIVKKYVEEGKLISDEYLYIDSEFIYLANDILINFLGVDYEKYKI